MKSDSAKRLLILTTTTGYQTREFVRAAQKLGLEIVFGSDRCHALDDPWRDGALPLKFEKPDKAARKIIEAAHAKPLDAIVALGDNAPPVAARAARALKLPGHPPEAADTCRDKYLSRQQLRRAGLNIPAFARFPLDADPTEIATTGLAEIGFPCVVKPLALSASRGVIRADDRRAFVAAYARVCSLLLTRELLVRRHPASDFIQIESYVDGAEVAVEGVVDRGALRVLAIFDKPDPLIGPYFEETIYVTPSRLAAEKQDEIIRTLEHAVKALGLYHGPLHAELRLNAAGIWMMEVAARSIGGLCARALRFRSPGLGDDISLEELIIRLALGDDLRETRREASAAGVMMIPVPDEGIFLEVQGLETARQIPGIEEIVITAKPQQRLVPLPEGSSYPGFIFARGESPERVEESLRAAHQKLHFVLAPALPVI